MSTALADARQDVAGTDSSETVVAYSLAPEGYPPRLGLPASSLSWRRARQGLMLGAVLALSLVSGRGLEAQVVPLDTTPPTITLTSPAGPYVNDSTPTIVISYSDDQSGVDPTDVTVRLNGADISPSCAITTENATCDAPELSEGSHSLQARVGDRAGNRAVTNFSFGVDVTPPNIAMAFDGTSIFADGFESGDLSAWSKGQPLIPSQEDLITKDLPLKDLPLKDLIFRTTTLGLIVTYSDALSGVDLTTLAIAIDGELQTECSVGPESTSCALLELSESVHVVTASVSDLAGNSSVTTETVIIDVTPPIITTIADPPANAAGWHTTTTVTVTFECEDAVSGVESCPEPVIVTGEGAGQEVVGRAFDLAGNVARTTLVVNIDATPPVIGAVAVPPANAAGWNNSAVTVTFDCQDTLSGPAVCPDPVVVGGDGADQGVTGTAFDLAGNSASTRVVVSVDSTPPAFDPGEFQPTPCPAVAADLMVPVRACFADLLSGVVAGTVQLQVDGVDRTASAVVADGCISWAPVEAFAPGEHQAQIAAADLAGNADSANWCFATASPDIDITIASPVDGFVTNQSTIDVSGTVDGFADTVEVNGVVASVTGGTFQALAVPLDEGLVTLNALATGAGGGAGSASVIGLRDSVPPVIVPTLDPEPNAAGWHHTAVTVSFECTDDLSEIATCPGPVVVASEGVGQQVSGTATDMAGNTTDIMLELDLDLTPPTIAATTDPPANASGWQTSVPVTVSYVCDDAFSGVVACPPSVAVSSEGSDQQIVGTVEDVAGNSVQVISTLSIDVSPPIFDAAEQRPALCPERTTDLQAPVRACFADSVSGVVEGTVQLTVDGADRTGQAVIADGCVTWNPPGDYGPGEHQTEIFAIDLAGNAGSATRCFDIDSPPIGITIDSGLTDLFTNAATIDVSGTVEEPVESVAVNGVEATVASGAYQVLGLTLHEGRNEITAVARNAAGNTGISSVVVTRDTTAPAVRIETPRPGAVLTSLQADVAGLVNDLIPGTTINADDCDVTVNGVEAMVANRSFLVPDLLLKRGLNTLTAVASDRLGNTRTHSIEVVVEDQAGQRIVLLAGNNQNGTVFEELADSLVVALEDASGDAVVGRPVTFEVSRGNGTVSAFPEEGSAVTVLTDELGHASVLYTLSNRAGAGNNRVLATAPGFVGEVEFCATAESTFGERVTTISGDLQRGVVDRPLPQPLVVLVTDLGGNPVPSIDIVFEILDGGGSFDGLTQIVATTDLDGLAKAVWTLGPEAGVNNNSAEATFLGLIESPASFSASALRVRPPIETQLSGVVLDNQDNPVAGVTLRLESAGAPPAPVPTAVSDDQGRFSLVGAPVGAARLIVDGSTTSRPGRWPTLVVDVTTISGRANELTQPIWILPLADNEILVQDGGPPQDVTLLLPGVAGAEITIAANSVTCPEGETECRISWTQVRGERLPMDPPLGSSFMLAGTFQPSEASYDPPAAICIPNVDQAPGSQVEIFSFDHDLGEFIVVGTATVTSDGAQICSDPGFGLLKGGWHGCVPPPPPCTSACGSCPEEGDCFTYSRQCPKCGSAKCDKNNKPDGTAVSNDDPGDCKKKVCQGGSPSEEGDPSETPGDQITDHECKKCGNDGPEADASKDGTIVDDCKICKDGKLEDAKVELSGVPDKLCVGETKEITARVTPDAPGITGPNFMTPAELTATGDGNNQTAQLTGNAPGNSAKRELVAYFGSSPDQCDTKREMLFVLPRNVENIPGKINRFTAHSFMQAECPDYPMQDRMRNHDIDGCSGGVSQDPMLNGGIFMGGTPRMFNQAPTTFGAPQAAIPFGAAPLNLPCNHHDVCYQTCGSVRATCDNGMETRMNTVCATAYPAACPATLTPAQCMVYARERTNCFRFASRYRTGLGALGSPAWTERQTQYCLCCEAP